MNDVVAKYGKFSNLTKRNILKNDVLDPLLQLLKESSIFNALNKDQTVHVISAVSIVKSGWGNKICYSC